MKTLLLFTHLAISCTFVASATYEVDIQVDYLKFLLSLAELRPTINGELNFSPNEHEFSNIVRSVAGKRSK